MPQINQLASLSQVSGADQIPVYNTNNGDARKMSVNALLQYFQTTFAAPTVSTNLFTPGAGFNVTVPTPVADQQWMILQPAGTLATGTVTLPLNTGVPDGTEVLITSTQTVTAFTLALNGAAQIFGNVSTLTSGAAIRYRYYLATNSWYNITNETSGFNAAIQAFLNNPTSANLRAAMSDETGTGLLVFATSPTLITPILGTPTSGTLTACTGLPIATGVSGLAANIATFLTTPTSANLALALTDESGTGAAVFANAPTLITPILGAATGTSLSTTGNQVVTGAGKQGYATGAGGGVLQATSKATTVVLNKSCGQITMDASALAASTTVTFTMTNSVIESGDVIVMNHITGGTLGAYTLNASCGVGTADINVRNVTLGALSEAVVLRFAVIKVVDA